MSRDRLGIHGVARPRRTQLELPEDLSIETWRHIGLQISVIYDSAAWWLGDWIIYGEDRYPDRYLRAISGTQLNYQTLRNYAWVARRFEPSRRRDTLSFQHHAEVAALGETEQDRWLTLAEHGGWSRNRLRNHMKESRKSGETPEDMIFRVRVSEEQRRLWEAAAAGSHRSLSEWVVEILNEAAGPVGANAIS